ncbi:Catalase-peroxidase 2 [Frankliniella fusca]|uniref:Catalase-peroxidase 2 n=1 Tax=Frankliniella fusca TaxID=407009 RepID=A0AAE1HV27_9NEOP|nr:Catalase-peroxidase 2 [Frankliniella fusca]
MKAVLVALVVFAAVLGAQASHLADLSAVAVLESALKGSGNAFECLFGLLVPAKNDLEQLVETCYQNASGNGLPDLGCLVNGGSALVGKYVGLVQGCLSS